jgi:hypothetical protein
LDVSKIAIIFLLLGLAGLATLAKDGQYYPSANPARQVALSTKMNVAHAPLLYCCGALENVAHLVPPKPRPLVGRRIEPELLPVESVGLTVSRQHRSPPAVLS